MEEASNDAHGILDIPDCLLHGILDQVDFPFLVKNVCTQFWRIVGHDVTDMEEVGAFASVPALEWALARGLSSDGDYLCGEAINLHVTDDVLSWIIITKCNQYHSLHAWRREPSNMDLIHWYMRDHHGWISTDDSDCDTDRSGDSIDDNDEHQFLAF